MTKPIEVWGCVQCDIEFKDEKETREHYDKFREKGDRSHVSTIVKMIGVVQKIDKKKKGDYPTKKMTKKNVKKLEIKK